MKVYKFVFVGQNSAFSGMAFIPANDALDALSKGVNSIPANLRGQELEAAFDQHTGAIWRGELGPADGIKQATAAVQEVLRLPSA
jgi:hypothetical protein